MVIEEQYILKTADGYEIEMPGFSGPLDLLLQLIRKEAFDIFDIPISDLTSAYLKTLDALQDKGFDLAAGFLSLAAQLVHLKSQLLLPSPISLNPDADSGTDPREDLVYRLLMLQSIQEVASDLGGRDLVDRELFLCRSTPMRSQRSDGEITLTDAGRLALSLQAILSKKQFAPPHEIYVEQISIGERIAEISAHIAAKGRISFASLCARLETREEVITTFLALLEMARLSLVSVVQRSVGAPVYLQASISDIDERGEHAAGTGERL
jgi:segregation and condensation protein A